MVEAPVGTCIGWIIGNDYGFDVFDGQGQFFFKMIAPLDVYNRSGTQSVIAIESMMQGPAGMLIKHYGGAVKEMTTDADTFSLHFPVGMQPQLKAVLLASVFMVDFRYFENK